LRLARRLELLGELAVLLRTLRLELDHLALHRAERLLHRGELLQDLVLRGRLRLALLGLEFVTLEGLAILSLSPRELLAQPREGRLGGSEGALDLRAGGRLGCPHLRDDRVVTRLQQFGIRLRPAAPRPGARHERRGGDADHETDDQADEQGKQSIHAASVAAAADICGATGRRIRSRMSKMQENRALGRPPPPKYRGPRRGTPAFSTRNRREPNWRGGCVPHAARSRKC